MLGQSSSMTTVRDVAAIRDGQQRDLAAIDECLEQVFQADQAGKDADFIDEKLNETAAALATARARAALQKAIGKVTVHDLESAIKLGRDLGLASDEFGHGRAVLAAAEAEAAAKDANLTSDDLKGLLPVVKRMRMR